MRCFRTASSSPRFFTTVLVTLFLLSISAGAATRRRSGNDLIRIWTVGSPHTNALPPVVVPRALRQRAESLGYTIEIEAFRASGFAAKFHEARQSHNEPEILTFDNYGVISGMRTVTGWVPGVDWDRRTAASLALVHETMTSLQSQGWAMLVRSAVNYEAARALAMRPPECDARSANDPSTIDAALRQAQEKAVFATRAYLDCDRSTLAATSDQSRMVQQCFLPQSDAKVESVKACSVTGNHKLAFVSLVGGFSAEVSDPRTIAPAAHGMDLGQQSIFAVLTNENGTWQLLAITHDPLLTVARIPLTTPNTLVDSLNNDPPAAITTAPARLLTPNGVYPISQTGDRFGDFTWQPSGSTEVIAQVVEFMWGRDSNWGLTRLAFLPAEGNKLSTGFLMSGGKSVWRVWSVTKSGAVVFSEQHSFIH